MKHEKKFSEILSEFYNRIADSIILCVFFGISIVCSFYVWFNNSSVDIQILIGFVALFFSFLFAAIGNIIFNDMEQRKNQTKLLLKVKKGFFWLGAIHLTIFLIYVYASGYPKGWMFKILFLIIMGIGNQTLLKYQYQPRYIPVERYQDRAA